MGVAQNALLGAGASVAVAASKFATNMKSMISEANDANKGKMMAQRAKQNAKQAVANKKEQQAEIKNTLKKVEAANKGQNKDIKTQVLAKELMRM